MISERTYWISFALLAIVYICGLFIPLMDNDAAHHAGIALHMHLTGDYISLVDHNGAYLDKPHLLFWLSAFSFKLFGVTSLAYKLPSFLFTILGVYSTYKIASLLYGKNTGRLSALIISSAFAFILSNSDVRMEAILTACIAFSTWQLAAFTDINRSVHAILAGLGLALGFSTKGHIAVFVPLVSVFFYILYKRDWSSFLRLRWLLVVLVFSLAITPVVYAYYLQYNLHPEVMVRGKNNINGVSFILWNQNIERFSGVMGQSARHDYSFFLHSFLWAFAPWSLVAYAALVMRLKNFNHHKNEWLTIGAFITVMVAISFSGYKLPHYVNIIFPVSAVITASYINQLPERKKWVDVVQTSTSTLILLLVLAINLWAFPFDNPWLVTATIAMAAVLAAVYIRERDSVQKISVLLPVCTMIFAFFLLNINFYPKLLRYQGGNELAFKVREKIPAENIWFWKDHYSPSFIFYTSSLKQVLDNTTPLPPQGGWILADESKLAAIKQAYLTDTMYRVPDYGITKLKLNFINPRSRPEALSKMVLVKATKK